MILFIRLSYHYLKSNLDDIKATLYTVKAAHHCVSEGAFADGVLYAEVALLVSKQRTQVASIIEVLDAAIQQMLASSEEDGSEGGVAVDSSRHYLGFYTRLREEALKKHNEFQIEPGEELDTSNSWLATFSDDDNKRGIVKRAPVICCSIS